MKMNIEPISHDVHTELYRGFREQIAVLYAVKVGHHHISLVRSFVHVCQPGSASFDPESPGADSFAAWEIMDDLIENQGVVGFFHTHPPGIPDFSGTDIRTQNGLAKTYGNTFLWHGVQPQSLETSKFVCSWMQGGRVFRYEYDSIKDNLDDAGIQLPLPQHCPRWQTSGGSGFYHIPEERYERETANGEGGC